MHALLAVLLLGIAIPALHLPAQPQTQAKTHVDWPQFRADDDHTGVNAHETMLSAGNVPLLELSWEDQLGGIVQYSSPAIVGGVAYIGSSDGRLWAYSADGCGQAVCSAPLWSSVPLAQIIDSPTVANGRVYIGSQTSPTSNAGKLNVFSATGCGHSTCAPLWQGIVGNDAVLMSSPAVGAGSVFIGDFDGKLYAFRANGCGTSLCMPRWTGATGGSIESTPTIDGSTVFVGSDDGLLYAFNARGCGKPVCTPLWTGALPGSVFESTPTVHGGLVYISAQHGVAAFKAGGCGSSSCAPVWQASNTNDFFNASPTVHGGYVYVGVEDGVDAYKAKGCGAPSCAPAFEYFGVGLQAAVDSSPTIANGVVYAGRNTGELLAWKEGPCGQFQCQNIWSGAINEEVVDSSPTVINGRVYIGSADNSFPSDIQGRIYVFALPGDIARPRGRR